jgi:hypothetical protein
MVIVLTGMQSINKKFLARILLGTLNKFELNGYTADFTDPHFSIFDSNGVEVYRVASENDPGIDTLIHSDRNGLSIIKHFDTLSTELFDDIVKHNHFVNRFCSLDVDFGLTNTPRYLKETGTTKLLHPHQFTDVINNIKNYAYDTKVITGTFGVHFLNRLKAALPNEEIHIINITRNPSVSWLMNKKPITKWNSPGSPDLDEALDHERFFQSAITSSIVMDVPGVQTVKFEDMMASGELKIGNTVVNIRDDYLAFNEWISNYESQMEILMSDEEFASFNDRATHYTFEDFYVEPDDIDEEVEYGMTREKLFEKASKHFPKNLFTDLGYTPLTKEEILKK